MQWKKRKDTETTPLLKNVTGVVVAVNVHVAMDNLMDVSNAGIRFKAIARNVRGEGNMNCVNCGNELTPKKRNGGAPKKYCSKKCTYAYKWKKQMSNPANREKHRKRNMDKIRRRRAEYFSGKSCIICGTTDDLQIHHIDPEDKESHSIWSWKRERMELELAKCTVLCGPCHQNLHHPRLATHGKITMYKSHKCRCDKCRAANASYEHYRRLKIEGATGIELLEAHKSW